MLKSPQLKSLPICSHLQEICETLKASPSRFLFLTAVIVFQSFRVFTQTVLSSLAILRPLSLPRQAGGRF